jgi:hypothetical protein
MTGNAVEAIQATPPAAAVATPAGAPASLGSIRSAGETPAPATAYGIDITDCRMVSRRVKRNQNLSNILLAHGVGYGTVMDLADKADGVFDLRSLRPNRPYCLIFPENTEHRQTQPLRLRDHPGGLCGVLPGNAPHVARGQNRSPHGSPHSAERSRIHSGNPSSIWGGGRR